MRHTKIIIAAVCLSALLFSSCTGSSQKINMTSKSGAFNVELKYKDEFKTGRNDVKLKLTSSYNEAVPGAKIEIKPWMPKMGHGVMWVPKVTDKGGGNYDALIMLSMGGNWELKMDIKKDDVEDKFVIDIMAAEGEKNKKGTDLLV